MPDLKLARLRDRTPIKLTISVLPDLHAKLDLYAGLYEEAYGATVPIGELIPAMLEAFLDSDKALLRALASRK